MSRFAAPLGDRPADGQADRKADRPADRPTGGRSAGSVARRGAVVGTVAVLLGGVGAPADAASGAANSEPVVSGAVVNSGHDVIVGITQNVSFPVTVSGSDDSGLAFADVDLKGPHGGFYTTDAFCQTATACTMAFTVNAHPAPGSDDPVDLSGQGAPHGAGPTPHPHPVAAVRHHPLHVQLPLNSA